MSNIDENDYSNMIYEYKENNKEKRENFGFKMIYKPNENKEEKIEKLKKYREEFNYFLDNDKEYSGDNLRIFGRYFVERNKNKCKVNYKNKKYGLKEFFEDIIGNHKDKGTIKLKLHEINDISDMSQIFRGCSFLSTVSKYHIGNEQEINDDFGKDLFEISIPPNEEKNENSFNLSDSDHTLYQE